ncbi:MAG TPA: hypothetical protein PKH77_24425 [Anaerolineae bacterium]|nr:hypothetical protein [Anaerolineae bacterium]
MKTGNATKYAVIIEWGGQSPPSRWYSRLSKLASFHVREGKNVFVEDDREDVDIGILAARATQKGVIAQEGAIICASESLASTIANIAARGLSTKQRDGSQRMVIPKAVLVGPYQPRSVVATPQDDEALARIEIQFGRRGRRPAEMETFTVCCFEERQSYIVKGHTCVNCPACGATNVKITHGAVAGYADPGGNVVEAWMRTRFSSGEYFSPLEGETPAPPMPQVGKDDSTFITNLMISPLFSQVLSIDRSDAFGILDAVYVSRLHLNGERRLRMRIEAATVYLQAGGSPNGLQLGEAESRYDLLDASLLGAPYIAGLLLRKG